jgi:putative heme-binding domain-containing protein
LSTEVGGGAGLREELIRELADLAGAELGENDGARLAALLEVALDRDHEGATSDAGAVLAGLAGGIGRAPSPPLGDAVLGAFLDRAMDETVRGDARAAASAGQPSDSLARVRSAWTVRRALRLEDGPAQHAALGRAAAIARDRSRTVAERSAALDVLAMGPAREAMVELSALLGDNEPSSLEARAIRALGGLPATAESDRALGALLVSKFRALGPEGRVTALGLLLRRSALHTELIAALEDRRVTVGELHLDLEQRRRLLRSDAPGVASRAAALLHDDDYGGRSAVVEAWLARLPDRGSAEQGKAVFARLCAQCHRAGDEGHQVGPGFASLAHRSAEDLVSNILDPDLAIHPDYVAFEVATTNGEREVGLIANETGEAVELLQAGGERRVVPRQLIVSMTSTGRSLMPAGMEQGLEPRDLRDLVAFIQSAPVDSDVD